MDKKKLLRLMSYVAHGIYGIGEQLENEYQNEIRLREIKRSKRKKCIVGVCIIIVIIILLVLLVNGGVG